MWNPAEVSGFCINHAWRQTRESKGRRQRLMVAILKFLLSRRFSTVLDVTTKAMKQRNYADAVKNLNSLQTNAQVLAEIRRSKDRNTRNSLPEMRQFTERAGVKLEDLDKLSVIHVSGTKGKGSTCAFCESILRHQNAFLLPSVRNCSGWNSELTILLHRDIVKGSVVIAPYVNIKEDECCVLKYKFLKTLIRHVVNRKELFNLNQVDVAIVEVGIGGAYDSTNIIRKISQIKLASCKWKDIPKLTFTCLQPGVPAFTVPQPENALAVVADRAREIKAPLQIVPSLESYPGKLPDLSLEGEHQFLNASLALQLCTTWLRRKDEYLRESPSITDSLERNLNSEEPLEKKVKYHVPVAETFDIPDPFRNGLKNTRWLGRNQVILRPRLTFYLDGAHTPRSMEACAKWFKKRADEEKENESGNVVRVLLFNLTGDRDPHNLLRPIMRCNFDYAMFSTNIANLEPKLNDADLTNFMVTRDNQLQWCVENQRVWIALRGAEFPGHANPQSNFTNNDSAMENGFDHDEQSALFASVSQAISWLVAGTDPLIPPSSTGGYPLPGFISEAKRIQVLVCGSLHLVGITMKVLGPEIVGNM
ncbi:PREDICTED: folylpolyglutamate synthase, mitochondrial-like [Acropora digitifera]|uniref:folylpolyglutamate synthase, mitochondrial-like n=1 Tax=Acropora digitifera TaxID=70779 RepID=UPI00077B056B|nr:PREDICTED: folylpolyglutamate synthase, mitochondrial-like [Acropora digitifera]